MNFIKAVKEFYNMDKSEEETFIVRKKWRRSKKAGSDSFFWALALDPDAENNLCSICFHAGDPIYRMFRTVLTKDDFLAKDWRVFNTDTWEMEE